MAGSKLSQFREQVKEARLMIEQAGFGDVLMLSFIVEAGDRAEAAILARPSVLKAMDDESILQCLTTADRAASLLENYGWYVEY